MKAINASVLVLNGSNGLSPHHLRATSAAASTDAYGVSRGESIPTM